VYPGSLAPLGSFAPVSAELRFSRPRDSSSLPGSTGSRTDPAGRRRLSRKATSSLLNDGIGARTMSSPRRQGGSAGQHRRGGCDATGLQTRPRATRQSTPRQGVLGQPPAPKTAPVSLCRRVVGRPSATPPGERYYLASPAVEAAPVCDGACPRPSRGWGHGLNLPSTRRCHGAHLAR
jgi:hypothetical protein